MEITLTNYFSKLEENYVKHQESRITNLTNINKISLEKKYDSLFQEIVLLNNLIYSEKDKKNKLDFKFKRACDKLEAKFSFQKIDETQYAEKIKILKDKNDEKTLKLEQSTKINIAKYEAKIKSKELSTRSKTKKLKERLSSRENSMQKIVDKKLEEKVSLLKVPKQKYDIRFNNLQNDLKVGIADIDKTYNEQIINIDNSANFSDVAKINVKSHLSKIKTQKTESLIKKINFKANYASMAGQAKVKFMEFNEIEHYKSFGEKLLGFINNSKLIIGILIFAIIVGMIYPRFFLSSNWLNNILNQNITGGLLAIGMTFIILVGGIDLSVGSSIALTGAIMLGLFTSGMNIAGAIIIGAILAISVGFIMGILSSFGKLQAFIVTLVGMLVLRGGNYLYLDGSPVTIYDVPIFNWLGTGTVGALPSSVFLFIIVAIITYFLLKWTRFGRHVYAVGSNKNAARISGIKTQWIITATFTIGGLMVAMAALTYIGNVKSIAPTTGNGFELDAIAAVVLGGTSLQGGKGGIIKTVVGWLVISILANILIFLGLDSNVQLIVKGGVILLAVLLDNNYEIIKKIKLYYWKIKGV